MSLQHYATLLQIWLRGQSNNIYPSRDSLYKETGWEKLKQHRERRKVWLFHKIHYGNVPSYLTDIVTPIRRQESNYNLRGNDDYIFPFTNKKEQSINSFISTTIKLWNNLKLETRNTTVYDSFKNTLKSPSLYS